MLRSYSDISSGIFLPGKEAEYLPAHKDSNNLDPHPGVTAATLVTILTVKNRQILLNTEDFLGTNQIILPYAIEGI